jgi:hypothetical protein
MVAGCDMGSLFTQPVQAGKTASGSIESQVSMNGLHEIIRVFGIILGGCVGMWMGAVSMLIVRLLRVVLWVRIIGRADWPSWAERYQDAMFIMALIVGAAAGAKFAHGFLQKDGDGSAGLWK